MDDTCREASCSCGKLRLVARGEPTRVSVCHCWSCQRRTGSAFGAQARWPKGAVTIEGDSRAYERTGDDGGRATFHFCPSCGATVHYSIDAMPDDVAVPLGAFASHGLPAPTFAVYEARKQPWVELTGDLERLD
jgi:hypothetical protein